MNDRTSEAPGIAESRPLLAALVGLAMFFGGGGVGYGLAVWLAPESGVAALVSFLSLPSAFMLSMLLWQGITLISGIFRVLTRGRGKRHSISRALSRKAPLLLPAPILLNVAAGVVTCLLGEAGFALTAAVYTAVGAAYAALCFGLGRAGMLPIFQD